MGKPLSGKTVLVMRTRKQAGELSQLLKVQGADVVEIPLLEICPPESYEPLDQAIQNLNQYDWILFTSSNGVAAFHERLKGHNKDIPALSQARIASVGPMTARKLEALNIPIEIVAQEHRAEGLIEALREKVKGKKILIPRAVEGREILVSGLKELGATVDDVATYQTRIPEGSQETLQKLFQKQKPDWVIFTSSSIARNFIKALGQKNLTSVLKGVFMAAIGPITKRTLEECGLKPHLVPPQSTLENLVQEIVSFQKRI